MTLSSGNRFLRNKPLIIILLLLRNNCQNLAQIALDNFKETLLTSFKVRIENDVFTEIVKGLNYIKTDHYKETQLYFITKRKNDLYSVSITIKEKNTLRKIHQRMDKSLLKY